VSLRVEDDPEPLHELRRLFQLHRAYAIAGQGDELVDEGRYEEAARLFEQAFELAPDNHELMFWAGLARAESDDVDAGAALVRRAIELQPGWAELLPRLPPVTSPSAATVAKLLGYA
jgi:tetratricopeptide (TPR) repeat protein